jgi:hypothetical protein
MVKVSNTINCLPLGKLGNLPDFLIGLLDGVFLGQHHQFLLVWHPDQLHIVDGVVAGSSD